MKTLVIHPSDKTTDFLSKIYLGKDWTVITDNISTSLLKQNIQSHDKIIMLGHGSPDGLFGFKKILISSKLVYLLRDKICICIWCHADKFFKKYSLKGYATGMIISDSDECDYYNLDYNTKQIDDSNKLLADSFHMSIDSDDLSKSVLDYYTSDNNDQIINFNRNSL